MKHLLILTFALMWAVAGFAEFFGPVIPRSTVRVIVDQAVKEAKLYTDSVDAKLTNYVSSTAANETYQPKGNYLTATDIENKVDKSDIFSTTGLFSTSYTSDNGTVAKIFNEEDGGGVQVIDGTTGVQAAMSVHAGGADVGLYGQWYAIKKIDGKSEGTRITVTDTGAFYTVTNTYQWTAEDEIATLRQINELRALLEAAIQRIQTLENGGSK